jgi:SOS-response transcriptional repressor LexA
MGMRCGRIDAITVAMRNARNDWLRERIKDLGKTGQGLANALGVNKARVSEIIGGRRGVKAEEVTTIAAYLEMTEQEVIARLSGRHAPGGGGDLAAPAVRYAQAPPQPRGAYVPRTVDLPAPAAMPLDLPVYGTAVGGEDADFEMNGEVIDRVRRPPGLAAARNAFALYVVGTSMSPRYDEGDLIFVHPGKPPVPGCDVVVELQALDEFGRHKALLKTYRGKTPTRLLLSQLNPEGAVELALDEVKQVLRVMRTNELLGV